MCDINIFDDDNILYQELVYVTDTTNETTGVALTIICDNDLVEIVLAKEQLIEVVNKLNKL